MPPGRCAGWPGTLWRASPPVSALPRLLLPRGGQRRGGQRRGGQTRGRRSRHRRPACSATSAGCSRWRGAASPRCTPRCGSARVSPGTACKSRPGRAAETRRRSPASARRSSGTSMSSPPPARPAYAEARAELAGETSELRRRLLDMLTSSPAPPAAAIASLARAAGWPLPRRVAAVALAPLAGRACGPVPPGMLADLTRRDPCLLVADPDGPGRRQQLATVLGGWLTTADPHGGRTPSPGRLAAVGPSVPLAAAGGSLRWAGRALALAGRGLIRIEKGADGAAGIAWCEDQLPTLLLLADEDLAAALSRQALAPLRGAAPRPGGPAGADAARLAGERRRRQCRRAPAARPSADDPLPAAAGQRAVRRRAR